MRARVELDRELGAVLQPFGVRDQLLVIAVQRQVEVPAMLTAQPQHSHRVKMKGSANVDSNRQKRPIAISHRLQVVV